VNFESREGPTGFSEKLSWSRHDHASAVFRGSRDSI
jgi:hypothetical protein